MEQQITVIGMGQMDSTMAERLSEVRWPSRLSGVVLICGGIWLTLTRRPG